MKTNQITKTVLVFNLILGVFVTPVFAQGPPPATPIDGGIGILLAAAGIYAYKKIRENQ